MKLKLFFSLCFLLFSVGAFSQERYCHNMLDELLKKEVSLSSYPILQKIAIEKKNKLGLAYKMLGISFSSYNEKIEVIEFAYLFIEANAEEVVIGKIDRGGVYDAFGNMLKKLERNEDANPVGISDALFIAPLSPQIIFYGSRYAYYSTDVFVGLSIDFEKKTIILNSR